MVGGEIHSDREFMRLSSLARVSEEVGQSIVSVHRALHSLEEGLRAQWEWAAVESPA